MPKSKHSRKAAKKHQFSEQKAICLGLRNNHIHAVMGYFILRLFCVWTIFFESLLNFLQYCFCFYFYFILSLLLCSVLFGLKFIIIIIYFLFGCAGSLLLHGLFSSCGEWRLLSGCGVWVLISHTDSWVESSRCRAFSGCRARALERRLKGCGTWI